MFRARLPRRALLGAAAAVSLTENPREKLPIYPSPDPQIILIETPTELERRIGVVRKTLTSSYLDAHAHVQGWVSRWIGVEHAVEHRVKLLIPPEEPLTPGLLYVGVATLTGSVIARNRIFPLRVLLPPTLLVLSLNHFLPKTASNLADYFTSLERTYAPRAAQAHDTARAHTAMTWAMAQDAYVKGREQLAGGVEGAVGRVQDATGLKLREALGWGGDVVKQAEVKGRELTRAVEAHAEGLKEVVDKKVEEAKKMV